VHKLARQLCVFFTYLLIGKTSVWFFPFVLIRAETLFSAVSVFLLIFIENSDVFIHTSVDAHCKLSRRQDGTAPYITAPHVVCRQRRPGKGAWNNFSPLEKNFLAQKKTKF